MLGIGHCSQEFRAAWRATNILWRAGFFAVDAHAAGGRFVHLHDLLNLYLVALVVAVAVHGRRPCAEHLAQRHAFRKRSATPHLPVQP